VGKAGGTAIMSKCGHNFIKQKLREADAVYGGEMSAHHYFRDFFHCDSGMIPWLLVAELLGRRAVPLRDLVAQRVADFPSSGEINFRVADIGAAIDRIEATYAPQALARDETDGLSLTFEDWRMNLRASNTEPLLRLNIEAKGSADRVRTAVAELSAVITG
jgi:phosphomannomutase